MTLLDVIHLDQDVRSIAGNGGVAGNSDAPVGPGAGDRAELCVRMIAKSTILLLSPICW